MKISVSLGNGRRTARQFQGCIRGTTIHLSESGVLVFDSLWLTVELTRGQVGLLSFKHKETANPVAALVDALVSREPEAVMEEAAEAMTRILDLAKVRPVTQKDLTRLSVACAALRDTCEKLEAKIDGLTIGDQDDEGRSG